MIPYPLITLLADGKIHSGEALGTQLNLTRSAISKQVQQLTSLGIDVYRIKGKGYRIPGGLSLLDIDLIKSFLQANTISKLNIQVTPQTSSTNRYLNDHHTKLPAGTALIAEHQTAGRGRRDKTWHSPFGANIYCSLLWQFEKDPSELAGLSLATGIAVANALERYGINQVQLKWPNDVLLQRKKIAGILVEILAESNSVSKVIIGVGLNVAMPANTAIDQPWTDVASASKTMPDRNRLTAYLIEELVEMLEIFQQKGFQAFFKHWHSLDAYYGQPVALTTPTACHKGIAKGITRKGEFILLDSHQEERRFLHGEVRLSGLD